MRKLFSALLSFGGIPIATATPDFTTPEGAIRTLEAAYTHRHIDDAVAARDFNEEARLMLLRLQPKLTHDTEVLRQTADVLEHAFRQQIDLNGFPDMASYKCSLGTPQQLTDTLVKVTETSRSRQGKMSRQDLHVSKGERGWRVVVVAP